MTHNQPVIMMMMRRNLLYQRLNRGWLSIPKLSTVYFVHSAVHIISKVSTPKAGCRKYIATLLSYVDAPLSNNIMACRTVANVVLKAHILHHSDREQALGCLRCREKLQWTVDSSESFTWVRTFIRQRGRCSVDIYVTHTWHLCCSSFTGRLCQKA